MIPELVRSQSIAGSLGGWQLVWGRTTADTVAAEGMPLCQALDALHAEEGAKAQLHDVMAADFAKLQEVFYYLHSELKMPPDAKMVDKVRALVKALETVQYAGKGRCLVCRYPGGIRGDGMHERDCAIGAALAAFREAE